MDNMPTRRESLNNRLDCHVLARECWAGNRVNTVLYQINPTCYFPCPESQSAKYITPSATSMEGYTPN